MLFKLSGLFFLTNENKNRKNKFVGGKFRLQH